MFYLDFPEAALICVHSGVLTHKQDENEAMVFLELTCTIGGSRTTEITQILAVSLVYVGRRLLPQDSVVSLGRGV